MGQLGENMISPRSSNGRTESFEKTLFKAADKLRKNIDAVEYKHIALGLIFLKYISDSFESLHNKLIEGKGDYKGADPEDADEYRAENGCFRGGSDLPAVRLTGLCYKTKFFDYTS